MLVSFYASQSDCQTRKDENCAKFGTLKTQVFFTQNFHHFHDFLAEKRSKWVPQPQINLVCDGLT